MRLKGPWPAAQVKSGSGFERLLRFSLSLGCVRDLNVHHLSMICHLLLGVLMNWWPLEAPEELEELLGSDLLTIGAY